MIQPGMSATGRRPAATPRALHATMLCFLTTDATVPLRSLRAALHEAVALSFNRISVDGDMSTNDTALLLANGLAGNSPLRELTSRDGKIFQAALNHVCLELAKMIVRDGEGVHRVATVRVSGAKTPAEADAAARAVANSALVKTAGTGAIRTGAASSPPSVTARHGGGGEGGHRLQRPGRRQDPLEPAPRPAHGCEVQGTVPRRSPQGI
jgi:glutamate N-acetyltransferase/amino-acid N-acetyltransferase